MSESSKPNNESQGSDNKSTDRFVEINKKTKSLQESSSFNTKKAHKKAFSRESIIGLGEDSFRKNYYPELQEKILVLEELNLRNKALLEAIPDVLIVSDLDGNLSPFGSKLKVFTPLLNHMLRDEHTTNIFKQCVQEVITTNASTTNNFVQTFNQEEKYYELRAHKTDMEEILIIIRDMTNKVQLENRLRHIAEKDALTQFYNRYSFEQKLLKFSNNYYENIGFLILDIDGLKIVNDTLGHVAGDNMIKTTASIINKTIEETGFIARIGGDEFGIIFNDTSIEQLERIIGKLTIEISKYNNSKKTINLSLSFGYSYHKAGLVDTSHMYQQADNNMYQNKLLKTSSNKSYLVKSLMKALEVRDYITEGHADRMGDLALKIGKHIGLTSVQLDRIQLLAKFHDIGKVGISDAILNKPGKLTDSEFEIMKTHSALGERIANESGELREISTLILKHHERYDGKGYPLGVMGVDIPIECRIISIVDAYDAMTNSRPYRKALSDTEACNELLDCSGSQFDPNLINVFMEVSGCR